MYNLENKQQQQQQQQQQLMAISDTLPLGQVSDPALRAGQILHTPLMSVQGKYTLTHKHCL